MHTSAQPLFQYKARVLIHNAFKPNIARSVRPAFCKSAVCRPMPQLRNQHAYLLKATAKGRSVGGMGENPSTKSDPEQQQKAMRWRGYYLR